MSRVSKVFMVTLAVMLVASSAFAQTANQRVEGLKGIGYFSSGAAGAPSIVGVRYWMNDGMAIDFGVGVGFENNVSDPAGTAPDATHPDREAPPGLLLPRADGQARPER